ncbi:Imm1 family immunity protein [Kitasatospora sp. NPDC089509]|uniref:Imm1 family immunity protein n=1 Tax=Kitasatospora sp. NPDC089509 TaxID=3364079 RepID=UPI00382FAF98
MLLTVWIGRQQHHPKTREDEDRLIRQVLEDLEYGQNASFILNEFKAHESLYPDSTLTVSLNKSTGFGGAVWYVGAHYPKQGGVYDHVWITDNPLPPESDPNVVSDIHVPVFMEPSSVVPLSVLQRVIEEFCRNKTGDRPTSIEWVEGLIGGERADKEHHAGLESESASRAQAVLDALAPQINARVRPTE